MRQLLCRFVLLVPLLLLIQCEDSDTEPSPADIAIYSDRGCWNESIVAARHMFAWMGFSATLVNAEYINSGDLSDVRLLYIPGGSMYDYARDLSPTGKENITKTKFNGFVYQALDISQTQRPTGHIGAGFSHAVGTTQVAIIVCVEP